MLVGVGNIFSVSDTKRFLSKVKKTNTCWLWITGKYHDGYGKFFYKRHIRAHRFSWELHNKKIIPKNLMVLHKCDVRSCVNPNHLFLGTKKDNAIDMVKKGRNKYTVFKGEAHPCAILDKDKILEMIRIREENKISYQKIGELFGVSKSTARLAINKKTWKHLW